MAGNVNRSIRVASAPSLCSALALWWICYVVGDEFESLIQSGGVVGLERADSDTNGTGNEVVPLIASELEGEVVFEPCGSVSSEQSRTLFES